jgi:hypothetical protein
VSLKKENIGALANIRRWQERTRSDTTHDFAEAVATFLISKRKEILNGGPQYAC